MTHSPKRSRFNPSGVAFLKLALKLGLTVTALWLVFHKIDSEKLGEILRQQQPLTLIEAFLLLTGQVFLGAARWRMILAMLAEKGSHILSFVQTISIYYIGLFFNVCLPGGTIGGDAVRVWLTKSDQVPLSLSIHSVIIDRIIALVGLGIMTVCGLPFLGKLAGFDGMVFIPVLLLAGGAGLWFLLNLERIFKHGKEAHIIRQVIYFIASLRKLLSYRGGSFLLITYSFVGHVIFCMSLVIIAGSLGINLTVANSLILIPPVILASTLPISVGGWGVREAGMIVMLALIGISQEEALMLSIESGLMNIAISLPGGIFWLLHRRNKGNLDVTAVEKAITGEQAVTDKA